MAKLEYFYSAHSAFAYLGSARLMQIAGTAGVAIDHKPVALDRLVAALGAVGFAQRSPAHVAYYFGRELERWAEHRGVAVMRGLPTHHRKDMTLPNAMLIAGIRQGHNVDRLAHAMLEAHWRDDADICDRPTLAALAAKAGLTPEPLLAAATGPAVLAALEENTAEAIARSVFGSPTYFVDGDMFYGQDHLELVERALRQPYKGVWPRQGR
ncbi:MAG: 2-hydroxychromene-2-carboxylate isomerase [Alphaproteobacteria bacterium]|nr:2-hydroxychromene-2-carboxylate isomerase [Alphaproteobacteria bacterium]